MRYINISVMNRLLMVCFTQMNERKMKSIIKITIKFLSSFRFMNIYILQIIYSCIFSFHGLNLVKMFIFSQYYKHEKSASEFDMLQQNRTVQNVMIREIMLSLPNVN